MEHADSLQRGESTGTRESTFSNDEENVAVFIMSAVNEDEEISADQLPDKSSDTTTVTPAKKDVFMAPVNSQLSPTEERKKFVKMCLTMAAAIGM